MQVLFRYCAGFLVALCLVSMISTSEKDENYVLVAVLSQVVVTSSYVLGWIARKMLKNKQSAAI